MKSYPGRIRSTIEINAPFPRNDAFQTSAAYGAWVNEVSIALNGG
jgi:hypothetical protein